MKAPTLAVSTNEVKEFVQEFEAAIVQAFTSFRITT